MEIKVVIIEGILLACSGVWAWKRRGTRPCLLISIAFGLLLAMFLHNFGFGVLKLEGPGGERDIALLVGFGIIAGVMLGIPAGLVIGMILYRLKPKTSSSRLDV